MKKGKKTAMGAVGWVLGDAEDFLELTVEERLLVALRIRVSRALREQRVGQRLTQIQVAKKLKTSQPRIAKIESGASDVSLDAMFGVLYGLGVLSCLLRKTCECKIILR